MKLGEGRRRQDRDTKPNQTKPKPGLLRDPQHVWIPGTPKEFQELLSPQLCSSTPDFGGFCQPRPLFVACEGSPGDSGMCGRDMPGHTRGMSRQLPSSCKGALNTPLGSWVDVCGCELDFHTARSFWSPRDHGGPSEPPLTQQPPSAPLSFLRAPFPHGKQPVCPAASVPSALDYLGK